MNCFIRFPDRGDYYGRFTDPQTGRAVLLNLRTRDKTEAMRRLKARFEARQAGLFQVLDARRQEQPCTLGQVCACYIERASCEPRTARNNVGALRSLLRHAGRHDDDAQPSTILSRDTLRRAQSALLAAAGDAPDARRTATTTANSLRRQARSLFTPGLLKDYAEAQLHLPTVADFLSAPGLKAPPRQFTMPGADLLERIRAAAPALRDTDRNAFRIYLLAAGCGLRKREIAFARWDWIREENGQATLTISGNEEFRTKSARPRVVPMPAQVLEHLRTMRAPRIDGAPEYLLDGTMTERTDHAFDRFSSWMQSHGWTRKKQAHELRKVFGSLVCQQAGLSVAQDLLGHSSVETTKSFYVGQITMPQVTIPL